MNEWKNIALFWDTIWTPLAFIHLSWYQFTSCVWRNTSRQAFTIHISWLKDLSQIVFAGWDVSWNFSNAILKIPLMLFLESTYNISMFQMTACYPLYKRISMHHTILTVSTYIFYRSHNAVDPNVFCQSKRLTTHLLIQLGGQISLRRRRSSRRIPTEKQ